MRHMAVLATLWAVLLSSCPVKETTVAAKDFSTRKINAVATTGMIGDLVAGVGGEHVALKVLMGPGIDPHLYKASEGDVATLSRADAIFYNGLHLEAKLGDILGQLRDVTTVPVAEEIPEDKLLDWEDSGTHDPHVWFDVSLWLHALDRVRDALVEMDPAHLAHYEKNAALYRAELLKLDTYVRAQVETVPESSRVLVTAHDAFRYFGKAYGFEVVGLQGISTEAQAGTGDVQRLSRMIAERKVPAIFVESSVPRRNIEAVQEAVRARGWKVQIGGSLYSDALGDKETPAGTYVGMVRHNIDTIVKALQGK